MKRSFTLLTLVLVVAITSCTDEEEPIEGQKKTPEACFEITPTEGRVGDEIQFTNCSRNGTFFVWTFGDGESSTQKEPRHVYQQKGTYEIKLLVGEDINADGVLDEMDSPASTSQTIEISPNHLAVELTIYSYKDWSLENPEPSVVADATVFFYKEEPASPDSAPDYTFTSDENGKIMLYDQEVEAQYFIVKKGDESNIVNGYLLDGIFQTQEEINESALQEGAKIGEYKYVDINADGVITESDKTLYGFISISLVETFKKDIFIGK